MKRLFFLLIIAVFILLLFFNPQLLDQIWLWMIGLAGSIIGFSRNIYDQLRQLFRKSGVPSKKTASEKIQTTPVDVPDKVRNTLNPSTASTINNTFYGTTVSLHRFMDDGETTLGILFVNQQLICYTLEESMQSSGIKLPYRIPAGTYAFNFDKRETPLTAIYSQQYPWFTYHLEIKEVPRFDTVYLYLGDPDNAHKGCVQIADSLSVASLSNNLADSIKAYQRLYEKLNELMNDGEKLCITIHDEAELKNIQLQNV